MQQIFALAITKVLRVSRVVESIGSSAILIVRSAVAIGQHGPEIVEHMAMKAHAFAGLQA
jgi:hypothetical protein